MVESKGAVQHYFLCKDFVEKFARFFIFPAIFLICLCLPLNRADAAEATGHSKFSGKGPAEDRPWSAMLYTGLGTTSRLHEVLTFNVEPEDSHFIGGVLNRQMSRFWQHFYFELEGQALKHFGEQNNWEFNGLFLIRFVTFPWDRIVDTSFAVGEGLSYATEKPRIERDNHSGESTNLLNYLMFELAFAPPSHPEWALVTRIHHRSGIFGLFDGVNGGSNFLGLGLRYYF